jgi:hypothetical protein
MYASDRTATNRGNALHSTGPKTLEGKERSAMNALKHGLTGQRLILQPEEHEAYRELTESLHAELAPKSTMEIQLVQKIIDTHMRLNRVVVIDNNLLNFGLLENLPSAHEPDDTDIANAQACSWMAQHMSFEKLGRYEGRLSRQLLAYTKEFERLQSIRIKKEEAARFDLQCEVSFTSGNTSMREALARHKARMAAGHSAESVQTTAASPSLASFGSAPPTSESIPPAAPQSPLAA